MAADIIQINGELVNIATKTISSEITSPSSTVFRALHGMLPTIDPNTSWQSDRIAEIASVIKSNSMTFLSVLQAIAVILGLVFAIAIVWLMIKKMRSDAQTGLAQLPAAPLFEKEEIRQKWDEVIKHLSSYRDAEWKFAVVEADKLVDDALQRAGFPGEDMGARLMAIPKYRLKTLGNLWDAHKLRNLVVHNINFQVKHHEVRYAIEQFEKTLRELGALD